MLVYSRHQTAPLGEDCGNRRTNVWFHLRVVLVCLVACLCSCYYRFLTCQDDHFLQATATERKCGRLECPLVSRSGRKELYVDKPRVAKRVSVVVSLIPQRNNAADKLLPLGTAIGNLVLKGPITKRQITADSTDAVREVSNSYFSA
ncbi:hypothetical protein HPB50_027740 [Hyalomma asiaticum]|nr:hypothetical protein HPB50_027740 [Hyalomma asiaticum]